MLGLQDNFDNQTTQPYTRPRKNEFGLLEYKMEFQIHALLKKKEICLKSYLVNINIIEASAWG